MSLEYLRLRKIAYAVSFVDIAIGLAELLGGVVLLWMNSDFKNIERSYNIYLIAYILLISKGLSFMIAGVFGIVAHRKKNDCMMQTKNIIIFIFLVVNIVAVIVLGVSINLSKEMQNDYDCTSQSFLVDYKNIFLASKDILCSRSHDCPCNASSRLFNKEELSSFYLNNKYGVTMVSQCHQFEKKLEEVDLKSHYRSKKQYIHDIITMLRAFESTFTCSGFCSENHYYIFKDMNDGRPINGDCKHAFVSFLEHNLETAMIFASLILGFLFFSSILLAILSYKKDKNYGFFPEEHSRSRQNDMQVNGFQMSQQIIQPQSISLSQSTLKQQQKRENYIWSENDLRKSIHVSQIEMNQRQNRATLPSNQIVSSYNNKNSNQHNVPYGTYNPIPKEFQTPIFFEGVPESVSTQSRKQSIDRKKIEYSLSHNVYDTPKP